MKLKYFDEEVKKIQLIKNHDIYFLQENSWISKNEKTTVTEKVLLSLLKKNSKNSYLKVEEIKNNWIGIFWLEKNTIAVVVSLKPKTRDTTLKEIFTKINLSWKHANLNWHANHDTLTGLLNRNGAQAELERNSYIFQANEGDIEDGEQKVRILESLAIISFDIDNFKQINDTYDHDAGDAVLAIFSKRLTHAVKNISHVDDGKFILSRRGGEEFELIIIGNLTRNILEEFCETLLLEIRNPSTSNEIEIKNYENENFVSFPKSISDVKILASIGVSTKSLSDENLKINKAIAELRKRADTALSRAKNDGKDCVRFFEDIRAKHGRIIECHINSDIAIIDIGRLVNVKNGDIYCVYYTPFTGGESYVRDDGRSKKKLGNYIPIESAKIQVIHVQDELSTCVIIQKNTQQPIPAGSLLKRLTVGSKPHFFSSRQFQTNSFKSDDPTKKIDYSLKNNSLSAVINLSPKIENEDFEIKSRLIMKYITYISMIFPNGTDVFLASDDIIYIIVKNNRICKDYLNKNKEKNTDQENKNSYAISKKNIDKVLDKLSKNFSFSAGIYFHSDYSNVLEITPEICLHLSRAALHVGMNDHIHGNIHYFDANRTILAWRREENTEDALADYRAFKEYGITDIGMENQIGLAILGNEDSDYFELAELALTIATEVKPDHDYFEANLGLIKAYMGKFPEAYKLLGDKKNEDVIESYTAPYIISLAKSALECKKNGADIDKETIINLIDKVDNNDTSRKNPSNHKKWLTELENYRNQ